MSKFKQGIYNALKGKILVSKDAFKNWRIIIYVVMLLLFMISRSHSTDKKVIKIAKLNSEIRELKAEFIDTRTKVMRLELESSVQKKVVERGLLPSENPPKKIKVVQKAE
ncbi:MAG: S-adenosyl-methyltransferase [Bacteroidetes bacterium MedPE-SWsnd-G1]|uniref:FtsL-like putative cell division protein n=1 Tax=Urechidicola vernalis TaxID=3075600 RepID=A0ABU2Y796_9FLAO|nr:FtsL-like putative cell division protein [Urechidicola sp. P050]MDT0552913.1 FtsL-like putative cell division protein [Urechidicola sp. P050]OIQ41800.1 MAG: S-adenosyl-methyltransferase [Bacteroidetes bacterium MedPE-SWsnd-G1]